MKKKIIALFLTGVMLVGTSVQAQAGRIVKPIDEQLAERKVITTPQERKIRLGEDVYKRQVVTDTLGDPTGEADAEGNATYTKDDLTRATADEIAACDYVLVGMTNAYATSYESHLSGAFGGEPVSDDVEEVWYPASLQYGEYTAEDVYKRQITEIPQ